jgi:hypothetical protein
MKLRQRSSFSFVRTEGAILPADLLSRIQEGDPNLGGLRPEDYHLISGERLNEAISRSWNRLLGAWASFQTAFANLPPGDPAVGITREKLLLPLFDELHYGRLTPTKALEINGKSYPVSHGWRSVPIHLVGYGIKLDTRTAGVAGAARYSPHGMMQELLNRSDDHLWGFVTNGVVLRILRDNARLTRQAFVEFNLESIFDGEAYADFALLWLLCHQSRVEAERPDQFWLERWSQTARTEGARALERLRDGVEEAIRHLGRGFVAHPASQPLRDRLRKGDLSSQDYYRQLLRLVYRLIFLFAAEDRDLLFPPEASTEVRERYRRFYSTSRLRSLAAHRRGTAHPDLYRGLLLVMRKLGDPDGCPELGLPALGSFLWSDEAMPDLDTSQIANHDLLAAVRQLAFSEESGVRRPIDYRNLGAEELGSVYEALLELNPEINLEGKIFELKVCGGSERKTTGSYYTPSSLIQQLLDTALDPVMDEALSKPTPQDALLDLKVCDPACGSGHFLVAAAHRIGRRLASARTGDEEPSPDAHRHALRDVIRRCVYGVDINPMAVELCKVNLWLEALDPGKPLSFLDHKIQCGNSLLGATPELIAAGLPDDAFTAIEGDDKKACAVLKKRNKAERRGLGPLFAKQDAETQARLQQAAAALEDMPDDRPEDIRAKELAFRRHEQTDEYRHKKQLADAWCAAFVIRKQFRELGREASASGMTQGHLNDLVAGRRIPADLAAEVENLLGQYQFFHWHLVFPEVFAKGGFDCVLGNPPWERVKLQEKEWFAERSPEISSAPNAAARKRMIEALKADDPGLHQRFRDDLRKAEGESHLMRNSCRYPLCGRGDINTYAVFAELMRTLLGPAGALGAIIPSGLATEDTTKHFFGDLVTCKALWSFLEFENEGFFVGVGQGHMLRFALTTIGGRSRQTEATDFVFQIKDISELTHAERHFTLSAQDIALLNPNTRTCSIFRSSVDAELSKAIHRRVPVLIREAQDNRPEENPWGITFSRMFDMSNDSQLFRARKQLEEDGWRLEGNAFRKEGAEYLPLYEAKMINLFTHRYGDFADAAEGERAHVLPEAALGRLADPMYQVTPYYWVPASEVQARTKVVSHSWLTGFRNVTDARASARSVIAATIPRVGTGNSLPLIIPSGLERRVAAFLAAALSGFVLDFSARFKIGGLNLNFFIVKQLPVLPPSTISLPCSWSDRHGTLQDWLIPRVLELTYTAWDLEPFAQDCGWSGPPFCWDDERRFLLRSELEAAFFHLYLPATPEGRWQPAQVAAGAVRDETTQELAVLMRHFPTPRDAVDYIMDTFPIVRRRDEERYGEYRTKRVILEIYDEIQRAIETGVPYQTRLDPPPADPRAAHPAKDTS